jgi:hypothetical protein
MIGRSAGSAANLMGQALALRHRLPFLWAQVESLNAEPWKACTVATACLTLSVEAAAIVDRRVASIINTVTPHQLENIVKAAIAQADPEAARAAADQKAKERGVWAGRPDEHGTTSLHIRAATGAVIRFKATLRQIADVLADLGDTGTLLERLARAVDIISDPALTHELLTIAHHLTTSTPNSTQTTAPTTSASTRDSDSAPGSTPTTSDSTPDRAPTTPDPAAAASDPTADTAAWPDPDLATNLAPDPAAATDNSASSSHAPTPTAQDSRPGNHPGNHSGSPSDPDGSTRSGHAPAPATQDSRPGNHPGNHSGGYSDPDGSTPSGHGPTPATQDARSGNHSGGHSDPDGSTRSGHGPAPAAQDLRPDNHSAAGCHIVPGSDTERRVDVDSRGWFSGDGPADDDEADRDPPHPSDPMDDRPPDAAMGGWPEETDRGAGEPGGASDSERAEAVGPVMDAAAREMDASGLRELRRKVAGVRRDAYATGIGAGGRRPAATTVYVHITDQTLLDGGGVARVERFGPVFAARLEELLGHGQIIIKPVIDLKDKLNVNAYEIPREIREHLKLLHPIEQFPYGAAETTNSTDLDHIKPYNFTDTGPPGQTSTTNLTPLRRYSHRVKTHGHWAAERLDNGTLEWTTRHGFKFNVDHKGTRPADRP